MMPTFEPVGIFYTQEQFSRTDGRSSVIWTYRHKPWGEQLFTESQIQQAYEAGKRDAVPEGYVIVPIEPTDDMWFAGIKAKKDLTTAYKAMLAAAPKGEKE